MKNILVPVDFSPASLQAVHYAAQLSLQTKAGLTLFHAFHIPLPTGEIPVTLLSYEDLEKEGLKHLKKLEKDLQKKYASRLTLQHVVKSGFPSEAILSAAEELKPDLIVMGVKGESKLSRVMIGSNTVSVIRKTKTPVLAVPEGCTYKPVKNIVLAFDFSQVMSSGLAAGIRTFTKAFGAKLLVLNVVKPDKEPAYSNAVSGLSLEHTLSDVDHSLFFPESNDVTSEINRFADTYKADWLIMLPHKHNFFDALFHKSNTKEMVFHSHIPMLSLHV